MTAYNASQRGAVSDTSGNNFHYATVWIATLVATATNISTIMATDLLF